MNDELDKLRREVERLTAERDQARAELADQKVFRKDILTRQMLKDWEGVTEADLDALRASGPTLQHFIDQLEASGNPGG